MIDINDYKMLYKHRIKKITKTWSFILILIIIGILFINKNFKYDDYYQNKGEYREKNLNIYVLIDDIDKITKNEELYIDEEKFAYKISSISKENIYLNNDYYKEVKLLINKKFIDNEIKEIKIINKRYSLLEYVFKTVWR